MGRIFKVGNKGYLYLLLIICIGIYLRLYKLADEDLWLDEILSIDYASLPFREMVYTVASEDINSPVFYVTLKFWILLFGKSILSVRALSVIFSIVCIPLIYCLGKKIAEEECGLISSLILAISPYHIWYAQEVRAYSLQVLTLIVSTYYLFQLLETEKLSYWLAYFFATLFSIYTQLFSVFVVFAQYLFIFFLYFSKKKSSFFLRNALVVALSIVLSYFPWFLITLKQPIKTITEWIPPVSLIDIPKTFWKFSFGAYLQLPKILIVVGGPLIIISLFSAFISLYRSIVANDNKSNETKKLRQIFLLLFLLVPISLFYIISLKKPIYVADRYLIVCLPAYCLLIGHGLIKLPNLRIQAVISVLLVSMTFFSLSELYFNPQKLPFSKIASFINARQQISDAIIFVPFFWTRAFAYYSQKEFYPLITADPSKIPILLSEDIFFYPRLWLVTIATSAEEIKKSLVLFFKKHRLICTFSKPCSIEIFLYEIRKDTVESKGIYPIAGEGFYQKRYWIDGRSYRAIREEACCLFPPLETTSDINLVIEGLTYLNFTDRLPQLQIYFNKNKLCEIKITSRKFSFRLPINKSYVKTQQYNLLELKVSKTFIPSQIIYGETDRRRIGLFLKKLYINL